MSDSAAPKRRYWIPGLAVVAYLGLQFWSFQAEHMMAPAFRLLGTLLLVIILWFWFCFLSGRSGWSRWLGVLGGLGVAVFLAFGLRYEGSTDGSGLPRFVLRWAKTLDEQSLEALPSAAVTVAPASEAEPLRYQGRDSAEYYGPLRNGVFPNATILPATYDEGPTELWKQPIGLGWSAFAVVGRTAVTQEQRGEEEWVTAYDLETGQLRWQYAQERRFSEAMGGDGPRATPSIHDGVVYALGATGVLDALDLVTGELRWSYDVLGDGAGNLMWGKSASPLVLPEHGVVVVTGGTGGVPTVQALSLESGEQKWKWGTEASSYASPIVATVMEETQLVVVNQDTVVGLRPDTGESRWVFDWPVGMMNPSAKVGQPTVLDGSQILVTASYGIGAVMFEVGQDHTGAMATSPVWHVKNRMKTKFSSACVRGGFAYGLDEGILACINLETGKRTWKDGRYGFGQNLLVGETLIIQAEDGDIAFVAANPEKYQEYGRFPGIEGKTWNVPTLAGEYLLVRNDREAACYRLHVEWSEPAAVPAEAE